jgi:hypothetical protein
MPRAINKLTAKEVAAIAEPGMYGDGAGLWLKVDQTLSKRWVFVYFLAKKRREMGLGAVSQVELKTARAKAAAARQLVADGRDPIAERNLRRGGRKSDRDTRGRLAQQQDRRPRAREPEDPCGRHLEDAGQRRDDGQCPRGARSDLAVPSGDGDPRQGQDRARPRRRQG